MGSCREDETIVDLLPSDSSGQSTNTEISPTEPEIDSDKWGGADGEGPVWTYDTPGDEAEEFRSSDYEVTVISNGVEYSNFVNYSYGEDSYDLYTTTGDLKSSSTYTNRTIERHSQTTFSFEGEVTIKVKVLPGANNITLPLTSAKVLPSSYNVPCTIEGDDTIVFTINRDMKVAVIPNYDKVWSAFESRAEGHIPIQSWRSTYSTEKVKDTYNGVGSIDDLTDGFRNPMIISALPPEDRVPLTDGSQKILYVDNKTVYTESEIGSYDVLWFKPGVYDWSTMFGTKATYQVPVKNGQSIYIEGGAIVQARFKKDDYYGSAATICGRGVVSGRRNLWIQVFSSASQFINIDNIVGITLTDRCSYSFYRAKYIDDVTMIGSWHETTGGPDYCDDALIQNCFFQASDDCIKVNHNQVIKNMVIWQNKTGHAIMVKETYRDEMGTEVNIPIDGFSDSYVGDIDVITYFLDPDVKTGNWTKLADAVISCTTAMNMTFKDFTFENIRIESPYVFRVFNIYNLSPDLPGYASWFRDDISESIHTIIDGMTIRNVEISSPLTIYRSLIGSPFDNSIRNLKFENITFGDTKLTESNKDTFFEFEVDDYSTIYFDEE